jgi:hypothetical protein
VKISQTLQPLLDAARRELPSLLQQLKPGQVLPGRVLERVQPGLLKLELASTVLLARSKVDIAPGTRLRLEVVTERPMPQLRILPRPSAEPAQQLLMRAAMPRQQPPQEIRQVVQELRAQATGPKQAEALQRLSAILGDAGVAIERLGPAEIRRALRASGLFHEARLAGGGTAQPADTKTRLLQLLSLLQHHPTAAQGQPTNASAEHAASAREPGGDALLSRLVRLVEASISRIQLQQAASLPADEGQRQAWQLDLPIQLPGETSEAMLRIEREPRGGGPGAEPTWSVSLAFDFATVGALECRLSLAGERVSTTFWCARPATQQDLDRRLPGLKEAFEAQGLEVVHLAGVLGSPPQPLIRLPLPQTMIDEHA